MEEPRHGGAIARCQQGAEDAGDALELLVQFGGGPHRFSGTEFSAPLSRRVKIATRDVRSDAQQREGIKRIQREPMLVVGECDEILKRLHGAKLRQSLVFDCREKISLKGGGIPEP